MTSDAPIHVLTACFGPSTCMRRFSVASASDPGDTHGAYYSIIVDRVYGL